MFFLHILSILSFIDVYFLEKYPGSNLTNHVLHTVHATSQKNKPFLYTALVWHHKVH